MSTGFYLVCHETKRHLWVGQGHEGEMTTFYSGEPDTMRLLGSFLRSRFKKPLVLLDEHDVFEWEDYLEYAGEATMEGKASDGMKRIERIHNGAWQEIQFEELKLGDVFKQTYPPGDEAYLYTALSDAKPVVDQPGNFAVRVERADKPEGL